VRLSRRQRNLYEDFMNAADTKSTLQSGNYMSLMGVLMQLRKVCNHPDVFAGRPIISPFDQIEPVQFRVPSIVRRLSPPRDTQTSVTYLQSLHEVDLDFVGLLLTAHQAHTWEVERVQELQLTNFSVQDEAATTASANQLLHVPYTPNARALRHDTFREFWDGITNERAKWRSERRSYFQQANKFKCERRKPLYSLDLLRCVTLPVTLSTRTERVHVDPLQHPLTYCTALKEAIRLPYQRAEQCMDLVLQFMVVIPKARALPVALVSSSVDTAADKTRMLFQTVAARLSPLTTIFRPAQVRQQLHFPDRRLIQWDCGKLQTLAVLLLRLKSEGHRVLLFTQMTKMLDILEAFLNLYRYSYLRLDGATKVENRQRLIERFNNNDKIFCFILSTRSGGIGLNLTGADTVIFYDTDWNPAMDQQAQDRCHRIGQTREVKHLL
jgi:SNF2 family DNA or RNA helicase